MELESIPDRFTKNCPHKSAIKIMKNAKHVQIDYSNILKIAQALTKKTIKEGEFWRSAEHICHPLQYKTKNMNRLCQYLFYINSINFSYWQDPDKDGKIDKFYTVQDYKTTFAQVAAFRKQIDKYPKYDILSPDFILNSSDEFLKNIFKPDFGHPEIPLLELRIRNLREVSKVLKEHFGCNSWNIVVLAQNSVVKFINIVLNYFPCFIDEVNSFGFYKRVQLLTCDIWNHCKDTEFTNFYDLERLSAFADYRVPQSLNILGCLKYSKPLICVLNENKIIERGSDIELEIRAGTINACDLIAEKTNETLKNNKCKKEINAAVVDNFLWCYVKFRKNRDDKILNHHLTRSGNY